MLCTDSVATRVGEEKAKKNIENENSRAPAISRHRAKYSGGDGKMLRERERSLK